MPGVSNVTSPIVFAISTHRTTHFPRRIPRSEADSFVFSTALNAASNVDQILDFDVAEDMLHLHSLQFGALGVTVDVAEFHVGNAAAAADDRIIYDAATGALFYDVDGNGATAAVQFASLSTGLNLTANNVLII